jgi:hypothetical protein
VRVVLMALALLVVSTGAAGAQESAPPPDPVNRWEERPECASMFMNAEWRLSHRQRLCRFVHSGVLSTSALVGVAWSARFSQEMDAGSERGDGFATRFGRRFGQNAFKSLGEYAGTYISREDPRRRPPFLVMQTRTTRGFFPRLGRALAGNVLAYRCAENCTEASHIRRTPAVARILGSIASGASAELLTRDRPNSTDRALRGAASAYASTFTSAAIDEFRPEISAAAAKVLTTIFGVR